jgi:hypothetical protein
MPQALRATNLACLTARGAIRRPTRTVGALMTSWLALAAGPAMAQTQPAAADPMAGTMFDRSTNVSVTERPRPEYDALGIPAGGFLVFPKVVVSGDYNDNIYAIDTGGPSDFIFDVNPTLNIRSNWNRHSLSITGMIDQSFYSDHTSENTTQWTVRGDARLDVLRDLSVTLNGGGGLLTEPRTESYDVLTRTPIQYNSDFASAKVVKAFNRFKFTAGYNYNYYGYHDNETFLGAPVVESYRNNTEHTFTGRGDYALSPATALFVEGDYLIYNYANQLAGYPRNSNAGQILTGVNFQLTHALTGEVGFGYFTESFDDPTFHNINQPSYRVSLQWYPTQLLTVTFTGNQTTYDSGVQNSPTYLARIGQVQGDWELRRNIIISARGGYANWQYQGIDRTDQRYTGYVAATYLMNRSVGVNVHYSVTHQTSNGTLAGPRFNDNVVGVALTLQR